MTHQRTRDPARVAEGGQPRVGRFTHRPLAGTWSWDDEVFRIHGLAPGSVSPTTDYVLQCKHPADRDRVAGVLVRAAVTGEPFSVAYRLIGADGVERKVVMVAEGGVCEDDTVTTIDGYYIDLTDDFDHEANERARSAVLASAEHRATIEQAKGCLMLAYGLAPAQAFAMLSWWSRNRNIKVRDLARHIVTTCQTGGLATGDLRAGFDRLFSDTTPTA